MTSPITIRTEAPADADAITAGTLAAFATVEVSNQTEHLVVQGLCEAGALTLSLGACGCCLVGHPQYYRRFGFANPAGLIHPGIPPEVFFALAFVGEMPRGTVTFPPAFTAGSPS